MERNKNLNYEFKEDELHLAAKMKNRQLDQVPTPVTTYEEEYVNPHTGEVQMVTVTVYPDEPNPLEDLRPAYAYGSH